MDLRRHALVVLAALVVAGCGGDGGTGVTTVAQRDVVTDTNDPFGPAAVKGIDDDGPGDALEAFVEAARAKDQRGMWTLLSSAAQLRAGPGFGDFRARAGADFIEWIGGFLPGYRTVLSQRTSNITGVAAVRGTRRDVITELTEEDALAAGAVKEKGEWRLELLPPGALELISPDTQVTSDRPIVVIGVEASAPVIDVGIWIDGDQYPSPTEGGAASKLSIFAEPDDPLDSGTHTLIAYASLVDVGGQRPIANAWTFDVP